MTFENITRILLPKDTDKASETPNGQPVALTTSSNNPDVMRTRRNKFAELSTQSEPLKKAA